MFQMACGRREEVHVQKNKRVWRGWSLMKIRHAMTSKGGQEAGGFCLRPPEGQSGKGQSEHGLQIILERGRRAALIMAMDDAS
jgi:hypothetical protein